MPDISTLLIIAASVAGLGWYAWTLTASYQHSRKSALLEKLRSSNRYRVVTIRNAGCPAVQQLTGNLYRFEEAPELPVEGCKKLRCTCVYTGINNRRSRERRGRDELRTSVRFDVEPSNRRQKQDRRKNNNIKWRD